MKQVGLAIIAGALLLIATVWFIATYNRFVRLRQHVRESWAGIDVELKRRHELIPNLVETVRGYASHERETLESVTALRARAVADEGEAGAAARAESALQRAVARLLAVAEAYPDLEADAHFRALLDELADTEDRIAAARRFYNGNVRDLRRLRESVPTNLVASLMGVQAPEYFELDSGAERVAPRVAV